MKPVTREQWVAALRSGDYQQARSRLYTDRGYCCLGVLALLAGGKKVKDGDIPEMRFDGDNMERACAFVPGPVADMVSITFKQQLRLAAMNDSGKTFKEIADYIDSFPLYKDN